MKTYFFTYGDDNFRNSKNRIKQEAINFGLFDDIKIYGPEDLSEEFKQKTSPYIYDKKGGGWWLWKSFLLKKTFDVMEEGDVCVYCDAGCTLNPYGQDRFREYIEMIKDTGVLSFDLEGFKEVMFSSQKLFEYFSEQIDSDFYNSIHIMATIIIIRKNSNSLELINEFYRIAVENTILFSDCYNNYNRNIEFKDCRHDQSVFSFLRKIFNTHHIQDETYADNMDSWQDLYYNKKIPFLSTRIRN